MGFFLAFLAGAFVAGGAVLPAGLASPRQPAWSMPGMEPMSIADVLLDAGTLCAVAASGNASSSAASNAERCGTIEMLRRVHFHDTTTSRNMPASMWYIRWQW